MYGRITGFLGGILGELLSGPVCRLRRRSVVVATLLQVCVASLRSARLINAFGDNSNLVRNSAFASEFVVSLRVSRVLNQPSGVKSFNWSILWDSSKLIFRLVLLVVSLSPFIYSSNWSSSIPTGFGWVHLPAFRMNGLIWTQFSRLLGKSPEISGYSSAFFKAPDSSSISKTPFGTI